MLDSLSFSPLIRVMAPYMIFALTIMTACGGDVADNIPPDGDTERVIYDTTGVIDHTDSEDIEYTYVIGNSRLVFYTPDRVEWSSTRVLDDEFHTNSVAQSDSLIVTVGPIGQIYSGPQWDQLEEQTSIDVGGVAPWLERVVYNPNIDEFWAIGDGDLLIQSSDGETWTTATGPVGNTAISLRGIAFADTDPATWVIVGQSGTITYSTDGGTSWTATDLATASGQNINYTLHSIAYGAPFGNGFFIATGKDGRAYKVAIDDLGVAGAWTEVDFGISLSLDDINLRDIAFVDDRFYIVGDDEVILSTRGGSSWLVENEALTLSGGFDLARVMPSFDTVVTVGQDRVIRTRSTAVIEGVEETLWLKSNR